MSTALASTFALAQDRPHWITGRVIDAAGRPLAGATLAVLPENSESTPYHERSAVPGEVLRSTSGKDGTFFVDLPSNEVSQWVVVAEAEGFAPRIENEIPSGGDVELVLGAGSRMHGEVLDPDGRPIEGATVHWFELDWGAVPERYATTDAEGRYELRDLSRASRAPYWRVIVEAEGFAPVTVAIRSNDGDPGFVQQRLTERIQHFVLSPGAAVTGTVRDLVTDAPLPGAEVVLWSTEGMIVLSDVWRSTVNPYGNRVLARTRAAADGSFRFDHVPVDGFHGSGSHNGNDKGLLVGGVVARADDHGIAEEDVLVPREGEVQHFDLRLPAVNLEGERLRTWVFDPLGRIPSRPESRPIGSARQLRGRITVRGDLLPEEIRVFAFPGSRTEEEFRARLRARRQVAETPLSANRVRADGVFELRNLPDGPLWLSFSHYPGEVLHVEDAAQFPQIELPALLLQPRAALLVQRISNAKTGEPIVPAKLSLEYLHPPDSQADGLSAAVPRIGSQRLGHPVGRGRFAVAGLEPGRWTLVIEQPGFLAHRETIEITADELVERSVPLRPARESGN